MASSSMVLWSDTESVLVWVSADNTGQVGVILLYASYLFEFLQYTLTFGYCEGASFLAFIFCVLLVST